MNAPRLRIRTIAAVCIAAALLLQSGTRDATADSPSLPASKKTMSIESSARRVSGDDRSTQKSRIGRRRREGKKHNKRTRELGTEPIQLKFQGSFEMFVPLIGVVRGEGSTTMELDRSGVERLGQELTRSVHDSESNAGALMEGVLSLPATLRSTNETLKMLADPETQQSLRQVESLLRLLPRHPAPVMGGDGESNQAR